MDNPTIPSSLVVMSVSIGNRRIVQGSRVDEKIKYVFLRINRVWSNLEVDFVV